MHTSLLAIALSIVLTHTESAEVPKWEKDYSQARKLSQTQQKPLALVIGTGKEGWEKLGQDGGGLSKEARKLLATEYICLYVDASTAEGKALTAALEVKQPSGLVLSDRGGRVMAFHHEGTLPNRNLEHYLRKYADPQLVVRTTETNPPPRTSYYQPSVAPAYQPSPWQYQFQPPVMSGRSC